MWRVVYRVVAVLVMMFPIVACGTSANVKPKTPKKNVNNPTFNLVLENSFGGPERELVLESFKQWEKDTNGIVKFTIAKYGFDSSLEDVPEIQNGCSYDAYVLRVTSDSPNVRKLDNRNNAKVLGYTWSTCEQRVVTLVTDRLKNAKMFRQVTFHEAGHLIGLDHIPVPNESVMYPSVNKATTCATALDMKQLCELYDCDWRDMNVCKPD